MNRLIKKYLDTYLDNTYIETHYNSKINTYYYKIKTNTNEIIKLVIPSDLDICYIYYQKLLLESLYKIDLITDEYHLVTNPEEIYKFRDDYTFLNVYKVNPNEICDNAKISNFIVNNMFNIKLLYEYKYIKRIVEPYYLDEILIPKIPLSVTPITLNITPPLVPEYIEIKFDI